MATLRRARRKAGPAPAAAEVCFRSPLQTAPPPGSPADRYVGIVSADSATIRLHELRITSHQSRIKCHTMPSLFRPNSLKTNDRNSHEVSHFFEVGKCVLRAPRALPNGASRAEGETSGNRYALPRDLHSCRVERDFNPANSYAVDFLPCCRLPRGTKGRLSRRALCVPARQPGRSTTATNAETPRCSSVARAHESRITSHESRQTKCHRVSNNSWPNSLKTNDWRPREVSHFFKAGRRARRAPRGLPDDAIRAEREKLGNRNARRTSFFTSDSFGLDSRTPAPEDSGYCGCGDEGRTLGGSRWGMTVSDYKFERGGCA
jgi:hypothetical protein